MKLFFRGDQPLTPAAARNFFVVNQFATPGLGSVMAGRWVAGIGQLLIAIIGFGMVIAWFALTLRESYKLMDFSVEPKSYAWLGKSGGIVFMVSWLWSLVTSIQLIKEAKANPPVPPPPAVPPKFS
jgi:hypothetical protein